MLHLLKKIADWLIVHEEKAPEDCRVPDEIIEKWEEIVNEKIDKMQKEKKTDSEEYEMLLDIKQRIEEIKKIRAKKCKLNTN